MNTSFDSTNLLEHLGIYDLLNVLLAGSTFMLGICVINSNIKSYICNDITFFKGLGVTVLIYILGLVLQELGSKADRRFFKIYKNMSQSILKGKIDPTMEFETTNIIIKNPVVLSQYRKFADKILKDFTLDNKEHLYENDYHNGYVFSVCQYYVSVYGKDKKVEKLRGLFAMSKTLMICFFVLSLLALLSVFSSIDTSVDIQNIFGYSTSVCNECTEKILFSIIYFITGVFFYFRGKRVMRNFLLVLLGTYNALVCELENKSQCSIAKIHIEETKNADLL